jgi:hypothetical protein
METGRFRKQSPRDILKCLAACGVSPKTAKNEWSVIHGRGIAPRAIMPAPGKCDSAFSQLVIHLVSLAKFVI